MRPVSVSLGTMNRTADHWWATAAITVGDETFQAFHRSSAGPLTDTADPFLPLALLLAMRRGVSLEFHAPLSASLVRNLDQLQDIYAAWFRDWARAPVWCEQETTALPYAPRGRGCFFTGSLESLHTALTHGADITHLIVPSGLAGPAHQAMTEALTQAAAAMGKPYILTDANVYRWLRRFADWDRQSEGAALASVALLLAPQFSHVYVSAAVPYDRQTVAGLHPLTSRLWGGDCVRLVYAGGDLTPWRKAEQIVRHPAARISLRPCRQNLPGVYNCGVCADCVMMMAFLRAFEQEHDAPTLPPLRDLGLVRQMPLLSPTKRAEADELRLFIGEQGGSSEIVAAVSDCLRRYPRPEHELLSTLRLRRAKTRLIALEAELDAARSSLAWRASAPLRALARRLRE